MACKQHPSAATQIPEIRKSALNTERQRRNRRNQFLFFTPASEPGRNVTIVQIDHTFILMAAGNTTPPVLLRRNTI